MKRYEYMHLMAPHPRDLEYGEWLNQLGQRGWHLSAVNVSGNHIFARLIAPAADRQPPCVWCGAIDRACSFLASKDCRRRHNAEPPVTPQEEEAMREKTLAHLDHQVAQLAQSAWKQYQMAQEVIGGPPEKNFVGAVSVVLEVMQTLHKRGTPSLATVLADLSSLGEPQLRTVVESCELRLAARAAAKGMR